MRPPSTFHQGKDDVLIPQKILTELTTGGFDTSTVFSPSFLDAHIIPPLRHFEPPPPRSPPGAVYSLLPNATNKKILEEEVSFERQTFPPSYHHLFDYENPVTSSSHQLAAMRTVLRNAKQEMKNAYTLACIADQSSEAAQSHCGSPQSSPPQTALSEDPHSRWQPACSPSLGKKGSVCNKKFEGEILHFDK